MEESKKRAAASALDAFERALNSVEAEPVRPEPGLRARILASIEPETRFAGMIDRVAALLDLAPDEASALVARARDAQGAGWVDGPAAGIRVLPFQPGPAHGTAVAGLIWCVPGAVFPEHRHHGDEFALALAGRARDSTGVVWNAGDLVHKPAGSQHSFETLEDEPVIAAVVVRLGFELVP